MNKKISKMYLTVYGIMVLVAIVMIFVGENSYDGRVAVEQYNQGTVAFNEGWMDVQGRTADLDNLHLVEKAGTGEYVSIYKNIPVNLGEGQAISFFARHIYYQVYVDGKLIDEQYAPESAVFNKSYGHDWTFIQLSEEHAGKVMEIRYRCPYSDEECSITDMYLGRELGIGFNTVKNRTYDFITSFLLLFLGIIFILIDIPINVQNKKNHELLYLGLIAICVAVWSTSETQLIQMFTGNSRLMNLISHLALMLVSMPAVLYAQEAMGSEKRFMMHATCGLSIIGYGVCLVLQILGISDLKENVFVAHIMMVIGSLYIVCAIIHVLKIRNKDKINIYNLFRLVGIGVFVMTTAIDLYRYYNRAGEDCAAYVRVGMIIFVMCYGFASMEKTIRAVQMGVRSELLSQLAYQDGLTGVGNRTAFMEHLHELQEKATSYDEPAFKVGVVMFDVNNLKQVNDHLGHQLGDRMIVDSSNIIEKSFGGTEARCFRIGGDEFSVIITSQEAEERIKGGLNEFFRLIEEYNKGKHPFNISIARGYSIFNSGVDNGSLEDICEEADKDMYENKKLIKQTLLKIINE